jgi:NAD(P)H-hydrate repair Nnr-like enzyme with NAD(P)H-hydrate epimerase domain
MGVLGKRNMKTKVEPKIEQRDAADFLGTLVVLNRGKTVIDASRELQEVINAIISTNKKGSITIKLDISPSGWKEGTGRANQVDIDPEITSKIPRHNQGKSIFFVTDDNKLTRDDPEQEALFNTGEETE